MPHNMLFLVPNVILNFFENFLFQCLLETTNTFHILVSNNFCLSFELLNLSTNL